MCTIAAFDRLLRYAHLINTGRSQSKQRTEKTTATARARLITVDKRRWRIEKRNGGVLQIRNPTFGQTKNFHSRFSGFRAFCAVGQRSRYITDARTQ